MKHAFVNDARQFTVISADFPLSRPPEL